MKGKKKQSSVAAAPKKYGKKPKETRYNIRHKGGKKYKVIEDSDENEDCSNFYVDSDYDLQ